MMDRFLHHAPYHRFLTYNGRKAGVSLLGNFVTGPDVKLCAIFGVAAGGIAAVFAPEYLPDVASYVSAALIATPVFGTVMEGLTTVPYMPAFFEPHLRHRPSARDWGTPYVIDKTPDGKNDLPTPLAVARELSVRHARMFRMMCGISGLFTVIGGGLMYKYGYNPKVLLAAPMLGGITVRFMASAERFERLRTGRYKLVKLPIRPANGHSPAP